MDELVPLIRLISKKKISDKYIMKSVKDSSKQDVLFKAIKKGDVENDEDAYNLLYKNQGNKHAYNRMKRRLKEKLYSSLVTLDQNKQKYTSHKKASYKVMKQFVIANLLKLEKQNFLMLKVLEDTLKQAIKYELTEYVKLISKLLIQHYSIRSKNIRKLKHYQSIFKEYSKIEEFEFTAQMYYTELSRMYSEKVSKKGDFMNKLISYSDELKNLQKTVYSLNFNHKAFSIHSTRYIFEGDYQAAIGNADKAFTFFEKKPFQTKRILFTFNSDKIISLILLKNHSDAEKLIDQTLNIIDEHSFNFYALQYFRFQNYCWNKEYDMLPVVVNEVLDRKTIVKFNYQYELWKIREAYTSFLQEAEIFSFKNFDHNRKPFRIGKFLNEVPIYSKEKRGMNISILVVQILFLLVRKEYDKVIDRIDALKQYSFRYLRNDDTFRSNCFIKMILLIPNANFHPVRAELHSKDLYNRLVSHRINIQELTSEIEVIPFHHLWSIILKVLSRNLKKGK